MNVELRDIQYSKLKIRLFLLSVWNFYIISAYWPGAQSDVKFCMLLLILSEVAMVAP